MSPLDALTAQRIRSLEIVVAWLIGQGFDDSVMDDPPPYNDINYIMELAENIMDEQEEEE